MSGFDADRVWNVSVHDVPDPTAPDAPSETAKLLYDFLLQYRVGGEFIYRLGFTFHLYHRPILIVPIR